MIFRYLKRCKENTLSLRSIDKSSAKELVESERSALVFAGGLSQPFLSYLEVAQNFSYFIDKLPIIISDFDSYPLKEKLLDSNRDMKMIVKNFDILVVKKLMANCENELNKKPFRRKHFFDILKTTFFSIQFSDLSFKEWAIDASERISNCYISLRILASTTSLDKERVEVENLLYASILGFKIEKASMIHNACIRK